MEFRLFRVVDEGKSFYLVSIDLQPVAGSPIRKIDPRLKKDLGLKHHDVIEIRKIKT